jgi:hypothetical protein
VYVGAPYLEAKQLLALISFDQESPFIVQLILASGVRRFLDNVVLTLRRWAVS